MSVLYLIVGGAAGTLSRFWLSGFINERAGQPFPYGTLAVNALGCFVAGVLAMMGQEQARLSPEIRLLFMVGFCGAFTTFSALILETTSLVKGAYYWQAFGNIALSVIAGFSAFALGGWIGGKI